MIERFRRSLILTFRRDRHCLFALQEMRSKRTVPSIFAKKCVILANADVVARMDLVPRRCK